MKSMKNIAVLILFSFSFLNIFSVISSAQYSMSLYVKKPLDSSGSLITQCTSTVANFACTYSYHDCSQTGTYTGDAKTFVNGNLISDSGYQTLYNCGPDDAQFISQNAPPSSMLPGQTFLASVTMKNSGTNTWTDANGYRLGSQNPQNNLNWGLNRANLSSSESIAEGQSKTFTFLITSPSTPGTYNFQWRMVKDSATPLWFGDASSNVVVQVSSFIAGCVGGVPDGYCTSTENQTACPGDCNTTVSMTPNANLIVGQPVVIGVKFADGRYLQNHNVSLSLKINPEGVVWNSTNGCPYGGNVLSSTGDSGTTKWSDSTVSNDYNFSTTFTCAIPRGLNMGVHTLFVAPTIFSNPKTLNAVQVQFSTVNPALASSSTFGSFTNSLKSFLGMK